MMTMASNLRIPLKKNKFTDDKREDYQLIYNEMYLFFSKEISGPWFKNHRLKIPEAEERKKKPKEIWIKFKIKLTKQDSETSSTKYRK